MKSEKPKEEIIQVKRIIFRVIGDSFPHREKLKELGCHWNSNSKFWEREKPFSHEEEKLLEELQITVQKEEITNEVHVLVSSLTTSQQGEIQSFKGLITEVLNLREFYACTTCFSSVSQENFCQKCHKTVIPEKKLVVTIVLDDQTEALKITFFGKLAERILNLTEEEKKEIIDLSSIEINDSQIIANKINQLIGQEIVVKVVVDINSYTKLREAKAKSFFKI